MKFEPNADFRREILRGGTLERVLKMIRMLARRDDGIAVLDMARQLDVVENTIRHYLVELQAAGLPLVEKADGMRSLWRIAFKDALLQVAATLDISHYFSILFATHQGTVLRGSPAALASARDLTEKVGEALSEKERKRIGQIPACFRDNQRRGAYRNEAPDVIWMIVSGIIDRQVCQVAYRSMGATEIKTSKVLPLRIIVSEGAAYLRYWSLDDRCPGTYHLNRVKEFELLEEHAEVPKSFDYDAYEQSAFRVFAGGPLTRYRLLFKATVADLIRERFWHPTEVLEERSGGRVELTFTCGDSIEVTRWIASWMDDVTVLEPRIMQDRLGRAARVIARRHPQRRPYHRKAKVPPAPASGLPE